MSRSTGMIGGYVLVNQPINWEDWWLQRNIVILQVDGGGLPGSSSIVGVW